MSIRLQIVDDHEVMRHGVIRLVEGTDIEVVAEADHYEPGIHLARRHHPDVVLLDIPVADRNRAWALECFKRDLPELPVIVLSEQDCPRLAARAMALGAAGFLSKRCKREEILSAIRLAASGEAVWTVDQQQRLAGPLAMNWMDDDMEIPLTNRQSEVLRHIASGLTTKQIAKALDIRYDTAKEHVQNAIRKIGVKGRTQAAVWAVRKGLV